jgi:uncharacterized protein YgbK (DUF1537 family)
MLTDLRGPDGGHARYGAEVAAGAGVAVVDAVEDDDLQRAASLFLDRSAQRTLFGVGSGGFSRGVARALGYAPTASGEDVPASTGPCLAVSGSCSQVTSEQIGYAMQHGWQGIAVDPLDVDDPASAELDRVRRAAEEELRAGRNVVVYTQGPGRETRGQGVDAVRTSAALADVVRFCAARHVVGRVLVAGGDTSGLVVTSLGASAIRAVAAFGSDTLLNALVAPGRQVDGLEVVLKGGQIGDVAFFERVRTGTAG